MLFILPSSSADSFDKTSSHERNVERLVKNFSLVFGLVLKSETEQCEASALYTSEWLEC